MSLGTAALRYSRAHQAWLRRRSEIKTVEELIRLHIQAVDAGQTVNEERVCTRYSQTDGHPVEWQWQPSDADANWYRRLEVGPWREEYVTALPDQVLTYARQLKTAGGARLFGPYVVVAYDRSTGYNGGEICVSGLQILGPCRDMPATASGSMKEGSTHA